MPIVALGLWLTRRWLLSAALPAGTDMLGFISRAGQNRSLQQAASLWNPASWGARRALTLESLLGLAVRVSGDPVLTVKLFSLAVLTASGVCAYALSWRLFGSRLAAATAGVLYMSSQGSLAHWASGHLNVEVGIALAPLVLLLWIENVERFRLARACCLAVSAAAIVVGRPDLLLYPIPFMVMYVVVRVAFVPGARRTLRNASLTALVSAGGTVVLSSYLIVPAAAGIRARWLTSQSLFDTRQLVDRSVGAYDSILGFAREIGYLAFTDQQTWTSHPWLPYAEYAACSTAVVILAYAALAIRRDDRVIFFAAAAVLAAFLGKGLRPPLGGPFLWAVTHVPVFGNLRDPNRWLIAEGLAYSVLAGLTVAWIQRRRPWWHAVRFVLLPSLVCAALLPVAPTLVAGFRTVSVLPSQSRLMTAIASDPQPALVASVPFDQTYRFVEQRGYRGWEHDLGGESVVFTNHPVVGDGGWDQQAADTVAFTSTLLRRGDPAFTRILGSLGAKYLLDLNYPATDPHLLTDGEGPYSQQRSVAAMPGLSRVSSNSGGRLYRLNSFAPVVSFRPNIALVLGGRAGIAALADDPQIDLTTWAVFTADDVLEHEGVAELFRLARAADLVIVDNSTANDVAVLGSAPVATLPGITSDPGLDQRSQIVASDASIRLGSLASQSVAPALIGQRASSTTFSIRRARVLELWARVRSGPDAARLDFSIDGRRISSLTPLTAAGGGFRWYLVARTRVASGGHRLGVSASRSALGSSFEVDEARLVVPSVRRSLARRLQRLLNVSSARTLYAFSPAEIQRPISLQTLMTDSLAVTPNVSRFWRTLEPRRVKRASAGPDLELTLEPGRRFHTIVQHSFGRTLDWSGVDHLLLRFKGTGSGTQYRLLVDFNRSHEGSRALLFDDRRPGWQIAAFGVLEGNGNAQTPWSHVVSVRIATDDRNAAASLELGALGAARATGRPVAFRVAPVQTERRVKVGGERRTLPPGASVLRVALSRDEILSGTGALVYPTEKIEAAPTVPVGFERTGPTTYRFTVATPKRGILMLDQSYDPRWQAVVGGSRRAPISTFALADGYLLSGGTHAGTIGFSGEGAGALGVAMSAASLVGILSLAWFSRRRERGSEL